jgi:hypothetical protein
LFLVSCSVVSIKVLYILLVLGTALIVGAAAAVFWRVRRHIRASSEHAVREALEEVEQQRKVSKE